MKQPVTQKKLIIYNNINNRKFGYFITLLKIKFLASQLASNKNSLPASPSILYWCEPKQLRLVLVAVNYFNCSPASGRVILVLSCDMTNCIIFHIFHFFLASVASMCIHFFTIMYCVYLYRYVSL